MTEENSSPQGEESAEARARAIGWVSPEDWQGDPPKNGFLDAEAFLKRGEQIIPIVNAKNRELKEQLASVRTELAELKGAAQTLNEMNQRQIERERRESEQLKAELQAVRDQAVADGDANRALLAERRMNSLDIQQQRGPSPQELAIVNQWTMANPWYEDSEMRLWADAKAAELVSKGYPRGPALLDAVSREAQLSFPERVASSQRGKPGLVEGKPRRSEGQFGKHTFDDLPEDAKREFSNFKRLGVKMTPSQYAKEYWEQ